MTKIKLALTSRTFWTIVVLFVVNGITGIHNLLPAGAWDAINPILGILATYFHVNPSQQYSA